MNWIITPFSRIKSILGSFRYFVLVSTLLFLVIMGFGFYLVYQNARIMRARINNEFNQQQLILARQASSQIKRNLHDIEVGLKNLKRFIRRKPEARREDIIEALIELTKSKGLIEIGLMDARGKILEVYHAQEADKNLHDEVMTDFRINELTPMRLARLGIERNDKGKTRITCMLFDRVSFDGQDMLYLFVRLDITRLIGGVTRDIRSGKSGYAWVIDETGMFLYHPEEDFIGKNAFISRKRRMPYISFTQINTIMKGQMINGKEGTGTYLSGWHKTIPGRESLKLFGGRSVSCTKLPCHPSAKPLEVTKLIAFSPVKSDLLPQGHIWSVAVVAPITEVAEVVHWVYGRHFAAEATLIAAVFVFGILVVGYQLRISRTLKERMVHQERYLSNILQNSVDAIIFVDNDNRVQTWNKGAELIFGYSAEEMIGETFHRLIPPELDADVELEKIKQEVLSRGYITNYIAPRITKSGRRITVDISRTLVLSEEGEIIGSTVIIKDVTEKMELEQRIYNTEKLASIGILAAGVAHEINNPLSIILGFTDLLIERFEPGSPEHEDLKIIEHNANNAKKIVENLLGFARVTEGLEDRVDIRESVNTVATIIKNTLMTKKINLVIEIPQGLPQVRGDAREFQQVIFNLINNSVAAMDEKGGTITISAWVKDDWVHLSLADTGIGIPDKIKPRIFDPFFTTKKVGEGTGLGLSLCYGIVKKYGGRITFSSLSAEDNPGRPSGTTFTVSMPVASAAMPEEVEDEQGSNPCNR